MRGNVPSNHNDKDSLSAHNEPDIKLEIRIPTGMKIHQNHTSVTHSDTDRKEQGPALGQKSSSGQLEGHRWWVLKDATLSWTVGVMPEMDVSCGQCSHMAGVYSRRPQARQHLSFLA